MRIAVELRRAYRLINHGPTTLISAAHDGRENVMAAAWVMPLDFDPPRLALVLAADTFTRGLVDASGELVVNVPTAAQLDLVWAVGSTSGRDTDKLARFGIATEPGTRVRAPLVAGCAAWLECRVRAEPEVAARYDLLVLDVEAAWADARWFDGREWVFADGAPRTIHHLSGGRFFETGAALRAREP